MNKKKNRKSVATYGKRKKYSSFFLRIFIPMLVVVVLLGGIVSYLLAALFDQERVGNAALAENNLEESVKKALDDYSNNNQENQNGDSIYDFQSGYCKFLCDIYFSCEMQCATMTFDNTEAVARLYKKDDSGSIKQMGTFGDKVFFIVRDSDDRSYKLSCNIDDYKKALKDAPVYQEYDDLPYIDSVDELYVKDGSFWVGQYTYTDYGDSVVVDEMEGVVDYNEKEAATHTVTVTDIPDGYEKLDRSRGFRFPLSMPIGYRDNGEMDVYEDVNELIGELSGEDGSSTTSMEYYYDCDYGTHCTYAFDVDRQYYVVMDFHYNFLKSLMGKLMIGTWCGIIFLSIIISLVVGYVLYRSYKEAYDMEQYRRTTSNAMAHDLKSPLAVISLYAENLKSGKNPEKNKHYVDGIIDEVNLMNGQISSILNMAKAEDVNTRLHKTPVDMGQLLKTVCSMYDEKISQKNVILDVSGECTLTADKELMYQAIVNIMDNAVKYVSEGGVISITLSDKEITFTNTCDELDEKVLADVWKPFVKGESSRNGHEGTGLGLSIVKTIIDRHGFDCEMKNVDGGVEVKIILS